MIQTKDKELPFSFTYKCLREFMKHQNLPEMEQNEKAFLLGINRGYESAGSTERITHEALVDLLDSDAELFAKLAEALKADMGKFMGSMGDAASLSTI